MRICFSRTANGWKTESLLTIAKPRNGVPRMLGLIAVIRSFLSVTLHLEVEGRWPWQAEARDPK